MSISGGQKPAVRIQANPTALAAYGLTLEDVRTAIASANVNQAKGNFDGKQQAYTIGANDQLLTAKDYRPLVVAYHNGAPVMLSDVANVIDDAENVKQAAWMNLTPAVIVNIQRQPGANIIAVVDRIKALLPQLQASLPASVKVADPDRPHHDDSRVGAGRGVRADADRRAGGDGHLPVSAQPVGHDHSERRGAAVARRHVRRDVPARLQPDNLSLMALTISTGFVVDDAIVMIENISRFIEEGDAPLEAALKGAEQIGFTILSLTISLIAVLIPLLFMGDIVGRLFREFAVTLAVTILVSAVVSLTLTPMMCAKLLRHTPEDQQTLVLSQIGAGVQRYDRILRPHTRMGAGARSRHAAGRDRHAGADDRALHRRAQGIFPVQDTGVIQGVSEAPQTVSFPAMVRGSRRWRGSFCRTRRSRACRRSSASTAPTPR